MSDDTENECDEEGCGQCQYGECDSANDPDSTDAPDSDATLHSMQQLERELSKMLQTEVSVSGGVKVSTPVTVYLDKNGWPVEQEDGQPIRNFLRRLIHTDRKIVTRVLVPLPEGEDPFATNGDIAARLQVTLNDLPDETERPEKS